MRTDRMSVIGQSGSHGKRQCLFPKDFVVPERLFGDLDFFLPGFAVILDGSVLQIRGI